MLRQRRCLALWERIANRVSFHYKEFYTSSSTLGTHMKPSYWSTDAWKCRKMFGIICTLFAQPTLYTIVCRTTILHYLHMFHKILVDNGTWFLPLFSFRITSACFAKRIKTKASFINTDKPNCIALPVWYDFLSKLASQNALCFNLILFTASAGMAIPALKPEIIRILDTPALITSATRFCPSFDWWLKITGKICTNWWESSYFCVIGVLY